MLPNNHFGKCNRSFIVQVAGVFEFRGIFKVIICIVKNLTSIFSGYFLKVCNGTLIGFARMHILRGYDYYKLHPFFPASLNCRSEQLKLFRPWLVFCLILVICTLLGVIIPFRWQWDITVFGSRTAYHKREQGVQYF